MVVLSCKNILSSRELDGARGSIFLGLEAPKKSEISWRRAQMNDRDMVLSSIFAISGRCAHP